MFHGVKPIALLWGGGVGLGLIGVGYWYTHRPGAGKVSAADLPTLKLDKGLTSGENRAVTLAVTAETSPTTLRAFSGVMLPEYPLAAAALMSRAAQRQLATQPAVFVPKAKVGAEFGDDWLAAAWDDFRDGADDAIEAVGPALLAIAQTLLSLFPGIGTAASAALGAGVALAMGKHIEDVIVDAAAGAIPGGVLASTAFKEATRIGIALARGDKPEDILTTALVSAIPGGATAVAQQAVQSALTITGQLARGKDLADAAVMAATQAARNRLSLLPGGAVVQDAAREIFDTGVDIASGRKDVTQAAIDALNKRLPDALKPYANTIFDVARGKPLEQAAIDAVRAPLLAEVKKQTAGAQAALDAFDVQSKLSQALPPDADALNRWRIAAMNDAQAAGKDVNKALEMFDQSVSIGQAAGLQNADFLAATTYMPWEPIAYGISPRNWRNWSTWGPPLSETGKALVGPNGRVRQIYVPASGWNEGMMKDLLAEVPTAGGTYDNPQGPSGYGSDPHSHILRDKMWDYFDAATEAKRLGMSTSDYLERAMCDELTVLPPNELGMLQEVIDTLERRRNTQEFDLQDTPADVLAKQLSEKAFAPYNEVVVRAALGSVPYVKKISYDSRKAKRRGIEDVNQRYVEATPGAMRRRAKFLAVKSTGVKPVRPEEIDYGPQLKIDPAAEATWKAEDALLAADKIDGGAPAYRKRAEIFRVKAAGQVAAWQADPLILKAKADIMRAAQYDIENFILMLNGPHVSLPSFLPPAPLVTRNSGLISMSMAHGDFGTDAPVDPKLRLREMNQLAQSFTVTGMTPWDIAESADVAAKIAEWSAMQFKGFDINPDGKYVLYGVPSSMTIAERQKMVGQMKDPVFVEGVIRRAGLLPNPNKDLLAKADPSSATGAKATPATISMRALYVAKYLKLLKP